MNTNVKDVEHFGSSKILVHPRDIIRKRESRSSEIV